MCGRILLRWRTLPYVVNAPADGNAFRVNSTGVIVPSADSSEGFAFRRCRLTVVIGIIPSVVASPAFYYATWTDTAAVNITAGDGYESSRRRGRLPLVVKPPASSLTVGTYAAGVPVALVRNSFECVIWRIVSAKAAPSPAGHSTVRLKSACVVSSGAYGCELQSFRRRCLPGPVSVAVSVVTPADRCAV